jgi:hypothetical protein
MATLIGVETTEATAKTYIKEKAFAYKVVALHSGTIEEIHLLAKGVTAEGEVDVGMFNNSAGAPGVLKEHKKSAKLKSGEEVTLVVSGFKMVVTKGETYHLAGCGNTGGTSIKYKKEAGETNLEKTATPGTELKEGLTWAPEAESIAVTFWATGTIEEGEAASNPLVMMI